MSNTHNVDMARQGHGKRPFRLGIAIALVCVLILVFVGHVCEKRRNARYASASCAMREVALVQEQYWYDHGVYCTSFGSIRPYAQKMFSESHIDTSEGDWTIAFSIAEADHSSYMALALDGASGPAILVLAVDRVTRRAVVITIPDGWSPVPATIPEVFVATKQLYFDDLAELATHSSMSGVYRGFQWADESIDPRK